MTLAVLDGRFCQSADAGQSAPNFGVFRESSARQDGPFPRQRRKALGITAELFLEFGPATKRGAPIIKHTSREQFFLLSARRGS